MRSSLRVTTVARQEERPGWPKVPTAPGQLGPWWLIRELGRGGLGVVFEARREDGVRAAVKCGLGATGETALLREARLIERVGAHPDLVRLTERSEVSSRPVLALELIDGEPLDLRLTRFAWLGVREAAAVLAPVARAAAHLHAAGVVHRDIKPSNIILRPDGRGVLVDLGLGLALDEPWSGGWAAGTPSYMPLEQLRGARVGPAADVFGLGATLHQALTGELPHRAGTVPALLAARAGVPPTPGRLRPLPVAVDRLIVACLAASASARPSAAAVAHALEAISGENRRPAARGAA